MLIFLVFLGGGFGSVCRYILGGLFQPRSPAAFPFATLVVNVAGCIVIGVLARHFLEGPSQPLVRAALVIGFCGGFTTFSAFSFETFGLLTGGRPVAALTYMVASVGLCLLGTTAGYVLGSSAGR